MSFDVPVWLTGGVVIGAAAWATKALRVLIEMRDTFRDGLRDVGTKEPPTGLFRRVDEIAEMTGEHRDWMIRSGLDRRETGDDRRHWS